MKFEEAQKILNEMTKGDSLRRHALSVSLVMRAYASKYSEDPEQWAVAGLLHDADYEAWPEEHPNKIVKLLTDQKEPEIAHAISAHYTKWGVSYDTLLDKALLACDEITGFIVACCQVRPDGINSLTSKSVKKKLKSKSFAASVDRDEVNAGIALLEVDKDEHINFIIDVLTANKDALSLNGN